MAGGVRGDVIPIADLSMESLQSKSELLRGKIALLDFQKIFAEGYVKAIPKLDAAWPFLQKAGVDAVVVSDRENNNVLNATDLLWGARMLPLPVARLGMEDGKLILGELEHGPVTIQFALENKVSGETKVNNVVAEIRGRERPDEWILIGAHLDSWDFGTGAQDNGTGAISVLEVARAIQRVR
jgi:Iap family predicted aminopeptidase